MDERKALKILVTGSSGHLGEAIMRMGRKWGHHMSGLDLIPSPYTDLIGSIRDKHLIKNAVLDADAVIHTATLHKPHMATHSNRDFVDTNASGTLNLLEASCEAGLKAFIFTSTTSAFGHSLNPKPNEPAVWITEQTPSIPKNIYGTTKLAAEDLCQMFSHKYEIPCLVLRTSRFFPEEDDKKEIRELFTAENSKANEFLHRRVDLEDAATAHFLAVYKAREIGFAKYIISATTPFNQQHLPALHHNAQAVVAEIYPQFPKIYGSKNWQMFPRIDRVYVNKKAREDLDWQPQWDFLRVLENLQEKGEFGSELSRQVGKKGYHEEKFDQGPYPVTE